MFLGESEHVLNEGVKSRIVHAEGRGTVLYGLKFEFTTKIETLVVSFEIKKPRVDVLAESFRSDG